MAFTGLIRLTTVGLLIALIITALVYGQPFFMPLVYAFLLYWIWRANNSDVYEIPQKWRAQHR